MGTELTGGVPYTEELPAKPIPKWTIDDIRQMRAYPDQPPVIPHSIEGYQLSVNTNRCLSCHKREFTEGSGAPMISVTHYMTARARCSPMSRRGAISVPPAMCLKPMPRRLSATLSRT